jgi:hypothetical protein
MEPIGRTGSGSGAEQGTGQCVCPSACTAHEVIPAYANQVKAVTSTPMKKGPWSVTTLAVRLSIVISTTMAVTLSAIGAPSSLEFVVLVRWMAVVGGLALLAS